MNQEKNSASFEVSDEEFIESYTAKKRRRQKAPVFDLSYLKEEVKNVWIYPLTTLTGKSISEGIRISNEKTTIMVTTPDKGQKVKTYFEETENYDLNEFVDPTNPTDQLMKNSKDLNLTTFDFKNFDFNLLYLLTFEKITEENFANLKKYLAKSITPDADNQQTDMTFVPIEEFSSLFKASPIKVVLSEPITEKIKEIHVTSPVGALIGNIKVIDTEGRQPDLLAKEGTEIFPKLVFPMQTQPHLATVEYWASKQIIPLYEIFDFLKERNIKFNQEFSLSEFLDLGVETEFPPLRLGHIEEMHYFEEGTRENGYWNITSAGGKEYSWWEEKESTQYSINITRKIGESYVGETVNAPHGTVIAGEDPHKVLFTPNNIENLNVVLKGVAKNKDAFNTICLMLTESFWKDMEFEGATKAIKKDGQWVTEINDPDIYKLQEKYANQDRYAATTNVWIAWKRKNPDLVNTNPDKIKRIENAIAMLSSVIKSNYSINKGDNDDYKVLLPYYFELQNKLDNPKGYVEYKDIKVKLKSNYGEFTENSFNFNYKNIAKSKIFELEYNHFAFPEMTKTPETAAIPSSMPLDQQLANGEYSKYLVFNFAKENSQKELYLKRYGSGNMRHDPISESLTNNGEFELEQEIKLSELEISAFYGYGDWKISFVTNDFKKNELTLNLFNKDDNKILVHLVL